LTPARVARELATSLTRTVRLMPPARRPPRRARRRCRDRVDQQSRPSSAVVAIRLVEAQDDLELIVAVLELRHFLAADQRAQVVGERVDVHAEVGRARAVDVDAQLGLGRLEVRVDVDDAGICRPCPSDRRCTSGALRCPGPE
jgi:hypothetical protein